MKQAYLDQLNSCAKHGSSWAPILWNSTLCLQRSKRNLFGTLRFLYAWILTIGLTCNMLITRMIFVFWSSTQIKCELTRSHLWRLYTCTLLTLIIMRVHGNERHEMKIAGVREMSGMKWRLQAWGKIAGAGVREMSGMKWRLQVWGKIAGVHELWLNERHEMKIAGVR